MKLIFIFKMPDILCTFEKMFLVLKIIAFELVVGISPNSDENTCDRPQTC